MVYILIWLILGYIGYNLMWIFRLIENINNKIAKTYNFIAVVRGLVLGLLMGPFSFLFLYLLIKRQK